MKWLLYLLIWVAWIILGGMFILPLGLWWVAVDAVGSVILSIPLVVLMCRAAV